MTYPLYIFTGMIGGAVFGGEVEKSAPGKVPLKTDG
jgi:hypothetical protein